MPNPKETELCLRPKVGPKAESMDCELQLLPLDDFKMSLKESLVLTGCLGGFLKRGGAKEVCVRWPKIS